MGLHGPIIIISHKMKIQFLEKVKDTSIYSPDFPLAVSFMKRNSAHLTGWVHFLTDDNEALVRLVLRNTGTLWISIIEVRHKGEGFGSQVLDELKKFAKTTSFTSLSLYSTQDAKSFYKKHGFCEDGDYLIFHLDKQ